MLRILLIVNIVVVERKDLDFSLSFDRYIYMYISLCRCICMHVDT